MTVAAIFDNFVVQVLIGVGIMVFLILVGSSLVRLVEGRVNRKLGDALKGDQERTFDSMRSEMNQLKEMLVDHSMSLDRNVEMLSRRVQTLENNNVTGSVDR